MNPKKILVVDDNPVVSDIVDMILSTEGYVLLTAQSGQDALEKLDHTFDLVLTDLMMPGMDGFTLIHRIKANYPNLPVIVLTAGLNTAEIRHQESGGSNTDLSLASEILSKPIDADGLIESIEKHL
jgi:two-component system response regulator GlrR